MLAREETRARFGLDEQGAQQALGLLRAQAAQSRATQATIRQQDEQQLLNTVLDLAQGTQGQAADLVAACKAVQASGLDPQSKQQVLLALEQGRINTGDEPQRVNALTGTIIRGEERGADTEMALTRAMAAGQLTQKSRERLLQLNAQIHGSHGPMLQHAYAGLAAHFGQDGSAAAQQQLVQQHVQAAFNQALASNNFQELERLSHPDAVAAIAARYRQSAQMQADYLEGFNPLEGPYLSAAQGGSRSDAGGGSVTVPAHAQAQPQAPQAEPAPAVPAQAVRDPRGVRNNNPGNVVDLGRNGPWQGQTGRDRNFATFDTAENGLRALAVNTISHQVRHGRNTVQEIIARHASGPQDDPERYAQFVAVRLGVAPNARVNTQDPAVLRSLMESMIIYENGQAVLNRYSGEQLSNAANAGIAHHRARANP